MEVRLAVYDPLGRKVRILIDEYKQAGIHTANFDTAGLSSGVYLSRLQVGGAVETRPVVLLRLNQSPSGWADIILRSIVPREAKGF